MASGIDAPHDVDPSFSAPVPGRFRRPVPDGPLAYRRTIRRHGPLLAIAPAAVGTLLAWVLLGGGTVRGAVGFLIAVMCLPTLLVFGAPISHGTALYALAFVSSAVLWAMFGRVAALRATRRPAATWREFWHELAWLAGATWCGVVLAVVVADLALGRALF